MGAVHVVIFGGHGQIARRLSRLLAAGGDSVTAVIRNPDHVGDVSDDGAEPVVLDLEAVESEALDPLLEAADAVVFAAGAGPGSSAERKRTLDLGGAVKAVDSSVRTGTRRFVMVGSIGTDDPPQDDDVFSVYLRAKADADAHLRQAGLDHTIVRPGRLTDEPGTGLVQIARHVSRADISRDDVAAVLAAVLHEPSSSHRTVEVVGGDTPVAEAVAKIATTVPRDV